MTAPTVILSLLLFFSCSLAEAVVPQPAKMEVSSAPPLHFPLAMQASGDEEGMRELRTASAMGFCPPLDKGAPCISLLYYNPWVYKGTSGGLPEGGYRLLVFADNNGMPRIQLRASSPSGFFYGIQTLTALLEEYKTDKGYLMPPLFIDDAPKYAWRGLHLDVSRHFFPKEDVEELIDAMALAKLNNLHLHLTDGPGWRLEIKKYPRLTDISAWRRDSRKEEWNWRNTLLGPVQQEGEVYGGFYTQDDLRQLIAYAALRHIRIVPEIDLPGHSYAALFAYPALGCSDFDPQGNGLRGHDNLCMGNAESLTFVKDILTELMDIFPPGTPIHIGGDEVMPGCGQNCGLCRERMSALGISTTPELQAGFMKDIVLFLKDNGRESIAWDEAFEAGLKGPIMMLWREEQKGVQPSQDGTPVILTPSSHFYFDYYQGDPSKEPKAIGGHITLERVFDYTPLPDIANILGIQGNLWTEYIQSKRQLEYMAWPRGFALAEKAWGSPSTSFSDFRQRLAPYLKLFDKRNINYRTLDPNHDDHAQPVQP